MSWLTRLWPFRKKEKEKSDNAPEISRTARSEDETFIPGTGNDPSISAKGVSPDGTVVRGSTDASGSVSNGTVVRSGPSLEDSSSVFDSSGVRIYKSGQVIGEDFEVSKRLEGGMGYVYLGRHLHYHMPMAVKQSKEGGEFLRRLKIEAEAWNRLGLHPHIAYCYWVKEIDNWPFIFVEYVEGSNLREWIYEGRCWELNTGLNMAIEICHGLKHAHDSGMLHRDVKPANILVDKAGVVKVTDFGLAGAGGLGERGFRAETSASATHTLPGVGTPAYMPPEQWTDAHNLGKEADIFSFGMCLWEMICGARAYESTLDKSEPRSIDRLRPELPDSLKRLLFRLTAWDKEERPRDFGEVIEGLNSVYHELFGEDAPSYRLPELDVAADNLNNQGVSYWELGQYEKARECFQKAVGKEGSHPQANFNLGRFSVLNNLLTSSSTKETTLEMLRDVLRDAGFQEQEIEERLKRAEKSGDFRDGLGRVLKGHTSSVSSVAFSPSGRYLASGSKDKTIRLWDVETGKELRGLEGDTDHVSSVAFSPDGRYLASGSGDIRIWDVERGKEVRTLKGHTDHVSSVAFSPSGYYLASGSSDETIRTWDVETGKELMVLKGHTSSVSSVAFSPSGRYLASGSWDRTIRIWDIETGKELKVLEGHTHWVYSVAFSPDGRYLASGSSDKTVRIWDVDDSKELMVLKGDTSRIFIIGVNSVTISPDGRYLAWGSGDSTVHLWEIESGKDVKVLKRHTDVVDSVIFSPDGRYLASGGRDNIICLWEGIWRVKCAYSPPKNFSAIKETEDNRRELLKELEQEAVSGNISRAVIKAIKGWQGEKFALISPFHSFLRRYWGKYETDVAGLTFLVFLKGHTGDIKSVIFSPDGRYLASGSWDTTIRLWEVETGKELKVLEGHTFGVNSVAFSPDGRYLASGGVGSDRTIRIWDVKTGRELRVLKGHTGGIDSVTISPDGRYLASGSGDSTVRLWEIESGKDVKVLKRHTDVVDSVIFSPDGRYLASGSWDTTIRIWEIENDKEVRILEGHTDWVNSVIFSPNGRYLASGSSDRTIRIWDVETGKELKVLKGHTYGVDSVAFSPDGRYLASGGVGSDKTIRIWEVERGEELRVLKGHTDIVESVAFSPDGRYLASGSSDNTIGLYCFLPRIEKDMKENIA